MDAVIQHAAPLTGALTLPPDKAICQRAVLVAALASGRTAIHPWSQAEDCRRALEVVRALGAGIAQTADTVHVDGGRLSAPAAELSCGESGTTLRLAAGLLAGQPFISRLTAGPALSRRPMRRVIEPLTRMGARVDGTARAGDREAYPPLTIHGVRPLRAIRYELPVASAQVKSAVLLAGLAAAGPTVLIEPQPTRDHTERLLQRCGVRLSRAGAALTLEPGPLQSPGALHIPGDISSAAFFIVAACCVAGSRLTLSEVGINPTRTGFLAVLARMGAAVSVTTTDETWEPRGALRVEARPLRAVAVGPQEIASLIDELPVLMVAAACAEGTSRFEGLGELRVKETDRVQSMMEGLQRLGARVQAAGTDGLTITGGPLRGCAVESAGDHRTAMSLAVAGLAAQGTTVIRGAECVSKSFPAFFEALQLAAGSPTIKPVDKP